MESEKYPHIKYGFRGEGVEYNDGENDVEIWSTWIEGCRLYLDDFKSKDGKQLPESFKRKWFKEVIDFAQLTNEGELPIVEFTIDKEDGQLWEELCLEHKDSIKEVIKTTAKEELISFYNSLVQDVSQGHEIHRDGYVIKTKEELDEYWVKRHGSIENPVEKAEGFTPKKSNSTSPDRNKKGFLHKLKNLFKR
jgi:hypothetical protein